MTAYAVLGGADFGAGFWDLTAGGDERGGPVRGMVQRSMSPVWEANHVWLIFVLVIVWTAFPVAFGSVFSTLYVPLFLAALGIISAAPRSRCAGRRRRSARRARSARSSRSPRCSCRSSSARRWAASPPGACRSATSPATRRQLVAERDRHPIGVLGVLTGAYLAAVFLAGDSVRRRPAASSHDAFRARALGTGVVRGAVVARRAAGRPLGRAAAVRRADLRRGARRWCSRPAVAGGVTLALVWSRRYEPARVSAAAAVAAVTVGWALAQGPYLLPGGSRSTRPRRATRR